MGTPIDLEKLRSIAFLGKGRTRDKVREYKDSADGHAIKETTDQLGNITTEHNNRQDQVDVTIVKPKPVWIGRKQ